MERHDQFTSNDLTLSARQWVAFHMLIALPEMLPPFLLPRPSVTPVCPLGLGFNVIYAGKLSLLPWGIYAPWRCVPFLHVLRQFLVHCEGYLYAAWFLPHTASSRKGRFCFFVHHCILDACAAPGQGECSLSICGVQCYFCWIRKDCTGAMPEPATQKFSWFSRSIGIP